MLRCPVSTLHDASCNTPCETGFRLPGWPSPGGGFTRWTAMLGFNFDLHLYPPPSQSLAWRKVVTGLIPLAFAEHSGCDFVEKHWKSGTSCPRHTRQDVPASAGPDRPIRVRRLKTHDAGARLRSRTLPEPARSGSDVPVTMPYRRSKQLESQGQGKLLYRDLHHVNHCYCEFHTKPRNVGKWMQPTMTSNSAACYGTVC